MKTLSLSVALLAVMAAGCEPYHHHSHSSYKSYTEQLHESSIVRQLTQAFKKDPELKNEEIMIAVDRDVVQLGGFVKTPHQASKAAHIAQSQPYVKGVINSILVRPGLAYIN